MRIEGLGYFKSQTAKCKAQNLNGMAAATLNGLPVDACRCGRLLPTAYCLLPSCRREEVWCGSKDDYEHDHPSTSSGRASTSETTGAGRRALLLLVQPDGGGGAGAVAVHNVDGRVGEHLLDGFQVESCGGD
jgi:hypothetical protein